MSTTNKLTQQILNALQYQGFFVWRQNNIPVRGRKFIGRKGVPDIIGFQKSTGRMIGVEVKTGKDKLSEEQKELHEQMRDAGAFIFVASTFEQFYDEFRDALEKMGK